MKKQKIDASAVQKMRAQLEEMPPRERLRPYDVITQLAETIVSTQGRGYDVDDVMTVLRASGIELARNTVRTYLSRALATRARRRSGLSQTTASSGSAAEASAIPPHASEDVGAQPRERTTIDQAATLPSTSNSNSRANPFKDPADNALPPGHFRVSQDRERI